VRSTTTTSSLEDQLSSVLEQAGAVVRSADGVTMRAAPERIEVTETKTRVAYTARPAVSPALTERVRDAIADLDRVAVGTQDTPSASLRARAIVVRQAEHARSPYVVSLRGVTLAAARTEPRIAPQTLSEAYAEDPATANIPSLAAMAALASDLCMDGDEAPDCRSQFTPPTFQAAYAARYGVARQTLQAVVTSVSTAFVPRFAPAAIAAVAVRPAPARRVMAHPEFVPIRLPSWDEWASRFRFLPSTLGMIGLLAVATLPAHAVRFARSLEINKHAAISAGNAGIDAAKLAAAEEALPGRIDALREASAQFRAANDALSSTNALAVGLAGLVPETRSAYRTARALAEIGEKSSEAGRLVATGLALALGEDGGSALDRLKVMAAYAEGALPLLSDAAEALDDVNPDVLPEDQGANVPLLAEGLEDGRAAVREFVGLADVLAGVLGQDESRRYLVIFQNPSELRPTGGFMGSFAELTVDRGELKKFVVPGGGTCRTHGGPWGVEEICGAGRWHL